MEEKGYIGGIQKFSTEDGPGIRTTVFMKGCPLRCLWCHNPELIHFEPEIMYSRTRCIGCGYCKSICPLHAIEITQEGVKIDRSFCTKCMKCVDECYAEALKSVAKHMTVSEVMESVLQDKKFYEKTGGGLTVSGGEMTSQYNFVKQLIVAAVDNDISVAMDTCGYAPYEKIEDLLKYCDWALYDVKAFDNEVHRKLTGQSNRIILENLAKLAHIDTLRPKIWIRLPLIKGLNDNFEMLERMAKYLEKLKIERATLLPYHQLGVQKYHNLGLEPTIFEPPSDEKLGLIKKMMIEHGICTDILGQDVDRK